MPVKAPHPWPTEPPKRHVSPRGETPNILQEAEQLTTGDRQADYGPPEIDYARVAQTFNAAFQQDLTTEQAIGFMLCVKLCREGWKHKRDNLVDLCGYAACLQRVHDKTAERIAADEGG